MALLRPTPWTSQPQVATEIDWSNPLTLGLVSLLVDFGGTTRSLIGDLSGGSAVASAPRLAASNIYGVGYRGNPSVDWHSGPNLNLSGLSSITVFASVIRTGSNSALFSGPFGIGTGATPVVSLETGTGSFGVASVYFSAWNSVGSRSNLFISSGAELAPLMQEQSVAIRVTGSQISGFYDGVKLGSAAGPATLRTVSNLYKGQAQDLRFNGIVPISCCWNRALSDAEIRSISNNPWQIFKPLPCRIFAPAATSSDHLIIGANSSQTNTASDGSISQSHLVTTSNSTQANTSAQVAINQTHLVSAASSTQANQVSDAVIQQTHLELSANSNQANVASPAAITQALDKFVAAADSTQANTASAGSISQTHLIQCAGVAIDNVASASSVVQAHLVGAANSVQTNTASSAFIYSGAEAPSKETITLTSPITQRRNLASPITPRVDLISRL